ncbi:MAG: zincin-like metallopeptidase domain-containing protein [Vitreimonas sp.]
MSQLCACKLSAAQRVTESVKAALEQGVRPWIKPWTDDHSNLLTLPRRANGEHYRGINVITLWANATRRSFNSPYWLTFKQAQGLAATVRKGEHGSFVVFYKPVEKRDPANNEAEDDNARRSVLRGYIVFNRDQIEGLGQHLADGPPPPRMPTDAMAALFERVPAHVRFGGNRAFYSPPTDHVQMPPAPSFTDVGQFYATLAHEFGHWTRHPARLDRDFGAKRFGDAGYALEELVAELCAAFVGAVIGLPADHIEDHAAYVGEWIGVLKDNPNAFLTAAAKAQVAADYLLRLMGELPASAAPDQ